MPINQHKTSQETKDKIIELYKNGSSITNLSKIFNLHQKTVYYHIKKSGYFKYKNKVKDIDKITEDDDEDYKPIIKLINAFFIGLFTSIKTPVRIMPSNNRKRKLLWYQDVLKWADEEELWFSAYEEFLNFDSGNLRKVIKKKVKKKIKELKNWQK